MGCTARTADISSASSTASEYSVYTHAGQKTWRLRSFTHANWPFMAPAGELALGAAVDVAMLSLDATCAWLTPWWNAGSSIEDFARENGFRALFAFKFEKHGVGHAICVWTTLRILVPAKTRQCLISDSDENEYWRAILAFWCSEPEDANQTRLVGLAMDFAMGDDDSLAGLAARSEALLRETSTMAMGAAMDAGAFVKNEPPQFAYAEPTSTTSQEPIVLDDDSDVDDEDEEQLDPTQLQEDFEHADDDDNMDHTLPHTQAIDEYEGTDAEEEPSVESVHVDEEEDGAEEGEQQQETHRESKNSRDASAETPVNETVPGSSPMRVSMVLNAALSPRRPTPHAPRVSPKRASPVKTAPIENLLSDDESEASAVDKFAKVLGSIWGILEQRGWQVAQGRDTIFCSMPGTQFFNFRPNINVFDSKDKACWKFIATAAELEDGDAQDSAELWEILWNVAETKFGWYTMACGPETWFVKPDTRFEEFRPNETIFQTKKRAALKCLEIASVAIELGDSVEGHQVIDFSAKSETSARKNVAAAKSTAATKQHTASSSSSSHSTSVTATPSPATKSKIKKAPLSSSSAASRASPPAPGSKSKAKVTPPKAASKLASKSGKKVASKKPLVGRKKNAASSSSSSAPVTTFYVPEFRCTFGLVYQRLQTLGWYHRPGKFEYDYFSPEYSAEHAHLNLNFFQSAAEFEEYLKDCGLWQKIEHDLREEHDEEVEVLRMEARKRLARQQERKEKLEKLKRQRQQDDRAKAEQQQHNSDANGKAAEEKLAATKAMEAAARTKEDAARSAAALKKTTAAKVLESTSRPMSTSFASEYQPEYKVSIGKVVGKLIKRGWSYRPGRFEYDYYMPNTTPKNARLNEDYFQSEVELETYLKTSGLWDEIARELRDEHFAQQEREAMIMSKEEEDAKQAQLKRKASPVVARGFSSPKKPRVEAVAASKPTASPRGGATFMASTSPRVPQIDAEEVEELANDIWANSHHFEFGR